ncbi:OsmC family protein [Rhizobium sp. BR 317]|uniref:OsmC family protein n=1 Tax=Rhizobium sp. BR 317 TaxID=3040015 RepID=UPI0039BFFFFA
MNIFWPRLDHVRRLPTGLRGRPRRPVNGVSVKLDGEIDLRALFTADNSVRPGFRNITGTVTIDSPATEERLRRLKKIVDQHCPVLDILWNSVPVTLGLQHEPLREAISAE